METLARTRESLSHLSVASYLISSIFVFTLLYGCLPMPPPDPPPSPLVKTLTWALPNLTPLKETQPIQLKGGISIGATPVLYDKISRVVESDNQVDLSPGIVYSNPTRWYLRSYEPTISVTPNRIVFTLSLVNNLDRVFRSAGTVVSLNVNDRAIAFDQSGITDFINVVLVPRAQTQVTISGPPLSVLQESGTIALFLYDVVTETDAAGNPSRKENFEWYYSYTFVNQSESVTYPPSSYYCIDQNGQRFNQSNTRRYPSCY